MGVSLIDKRGEKGKKNEINEKNPLLEIWKGESEKKCLHIVFPCDKVNQHDLLILTSATSIIWISIATA